VLLTALIVLFLNDYITAIENKVTSSPGLNSDNVNMIEVPDCNIKLGPYKFECEKKYKKSDLYVINLSDEKVRRKLCCDHWQTMTCIAKKAAHLPECGPEEAQRILEKPIRPLLEKEFEDLCDQYTDYKHICDTNFILDKDELEVWLTIASIVMFGLFYTYPGVLFMILRFFIEIF